MLKMMFAALLLLAVVPLANAANYIAPEELRQALQQKKELVIIDIQTAKDFEQQHIQGSIETNAYPAKTDEEKKHLDKTLPLIKASTAPVVVVCPRGKGGAMNSYDYLVKQGVPEERLRILEGGIAGWPFKELLKQGR